MPVRLSSAGGRRSQTVSVRKAKAFVGEVSGMDHVFPCKLFRLFAVARQHGVQNQDVFLLRKADLIVVFFRFQPNPAVMFID